MPCGNAVFTKLYDNRFYLFFYKCKTVLKFRRKKTATNGDEQFVTVVENKFNCKHDTTSFSAGVIWRDDA